MRALVLLVAVGSFALAAPAHARGHTKVIVVKHTKKKPRSAPH